MSEPAAGGVVQRAKSESECFEKRAQRHHAAVLALIGSAVAERGVSAGRKVYVDLDPELVGVAVDAADPPPQE